MTGEFFRLILNPFVRIKKEEWPKTLLMSLYFFLTITSYYILKPIRDSVFIDKYGAENLPYVWLLTIVVLSFIVSIYVKVADLVQKNILMSSTVIFFVSNLVGFWWLSHSENRWIAVVFFVWVSIFSVMSVTQFWLYANDLFNPREAKRLFGFVGSGGILGGITGGMITHQLATAVGTRNLLLVAAFILLLCALLINMIWVLEKGKGFIALGEGQSKEPVKVKETSQALRLIWEKRYLLLLVGLVCVTKIVSTLVDYQFKNIIQTQITGLDARTAFFGQFFAWLNTVSLVVQFFFTGSILRRFGVGGALYLLPAGLAFGSLGILIHPALWNAVFTMIYDGSMNYSLNQSTKEVLYLPIFREVRYRVKPFIDMVGYRMAKAIGSLLILFFVHQLHFSVRTLSFICLVLIAFWLYMIYVMRGEYVNALREFLKTDLPKEHERVAAKSEAWLLFGLLKQGTGSDEKALHLAVRLYNLAQDPAFHDFLREDLGKPEEELRSNLEHFITQEKIPGLLKEIRIFLKTRDFQEAGEALKFFGDFRPGSPGWLEQCLQSQDSAVRMAAACAQWLLEGRGGEGMKAKNTLLEELASASSSAAQTAERLFAQNGAAFGSKEALLEVLQWLSQDLVHHEELLNQIRESAKTQRSILDCLSALVEEKRLPSVYRRQLPILLGACGSQAGASLIYRTLSDEDIAVRDQAIHVLADLRLKGEAPFFENKVIEAEIEKEITQALLVQRLSALYKQPGSQPKGTMDSDGGDPFLKAQDKRFHETVSRIFLLLSILAEPGDVRTVYYSLKHPNEHVKANALELLESIIKKPSLKRAILQVIDAESSQSSLEQFGRILKSFNGIAPEAPLSLEGLGQREDAWSLLSFVYIVLRFEIRSFLPQFKSPHFFKQRLVQEAAALANQRLVSPVKI